MGPAITRRLRKTGKLAMGLFAVALLSIEIYGAMGYYLAPRWVRDQVLPRISEAIGAELTAASVAVDPFGFSVTAGGLSLKKKGRELAAIKSLSLEIDVESSIGSRRPILRLRLLEPLARLERDRRGRFNFAGLFSEGTNSGAAGLPYGVTTGLVQGGRLEFRDLSGAKPYSKVFENVALRLEDFGSDPSLKTSFQGVAKTGAGESLSVLGTFSRSPLVMAGEVRVGAAALPPLMDYLFPDWMLRIQAGKASGKAGVAFESGSGHGFEIRSGELRAEGLELAFRGEPGRWLKLAALSASGLSYSGADSVFELAALNTGEGISPWLRIGSGAAGAVVYSLVKDRWQLASARLLEVAVRPDPAIGNGTAPKERPGGVRIGSVELDGVVVDVPARTVEIARLSSREGNAEVRRLPGDAVAFTGLPMPAEGRDGAMDAPPWQFGIEETRLEEYAATVRDETVTPPVVLSFGPAALRMVEFNTGRGRQFALRLESRVEDRGRIELEGIARLEPLTVDLRCAVEQFRLRSLQAYWQDRPAIDLIKGRLGLQGDITVRRAPEWHLDYQGTAEIGDLAILDSTGRMPLIRWDSMRFDGLVARTEPAGLSVRSVSVEQPYARVIVDEGSGLNLRHQFARRAQSPVTAGPGEERRIRPVTVNLLRVRDGSMDFSDLTLKPPFTAEIQGLDGTISGLSSNPDTRANVFLRGRIDHNAPVRIAGLINPFQFTNHTDVTLEFRGVDMTTLSPYSGKFAGYRIEKGKLDMDLRYRVHNRKLEADNRARLDQLVLGERVDSPKATTLPVDLAVALLKDSEGLIDLDLPISGDLDNPEFSLGNLYADAFTRFLAKVVGSPWALVTNLVGGTVEDLGSVKFAPGGGSVSADEKAQLGKLAVVLAARPGLQLEIRGLADSGRDRLALAERSLNEQLRNLRRIELRAKGLKTWTPGALDLQDQDYRRLFTVFYRHHHPDAPELKALAGNPASGLQGIPFEQARRKVLEQWNIDEADLRRLAQLRARNIRDYLVTVGGLPERRIYLLDVKLDPPSTTDIKAMLSLAEP